ncbi:MAG: hypothetical protein RI953_675 [Pseudomonadota bacterium]
MYLGWVRGRLAWKWQARRDSNPQPVDLESTALPLELLTFARTDVCRKSHRGQVLTCWMNCVYVPAEEMPYGDQASHKFKTQRFAFSHPA